MRTLTFLTVCLTACAACPGNGGDPDLPQLSCEAAEIRSREAALWRSLLAKTEGIEMGCYALAQPINAWLDEHEDELRAVTAEIERCEPRSTTESESLFMRAMLLTDPTCAADTPMHATKMRLEAAAGVTSIPISP